MLAGRGPILPSPARVSHLFSLVLLLFLLNFGFGPASFPPLASSPPPPADEPRQESEFLAAQPDVVERLRADLPDCVVTSVVDLSPALMVHTGPEAIGITLVHG